MSLPLVLVSYEFWFWLSPSLIETLYLQEMRVIFVCCTSSRRWDGVCIYNIYLYRYLKTPDIVYENIMQSSVARSAT